MQFLDYQVPYLGNGMVIGLNAVIHVVLSHGVAIGAFAMVVLGDWLDWRRSGSAPNEWNRFNKRLLKFVALAITIVGGLTGVGIWFTTSALATRGIASMLRIFFWPWFLEWVVFVLEVSGVLAYYLYWDRLAMRRALRLGVGIVYVGLAFLSAFLITGILGFMLTPGDWPEHRKLGVAFFNPSFAPQLAWRLFLSFSVGALIALAFSQAAGFTAEFRKETAKTFGGILTVSLMGLAISVLIYFRQVPLAFAVESRFAVLTGRLSQLPWLFLALNIAAATVLVATAISGLLGKTQLARVLALPAILMMVALTAELERIREFIRGPYLIPNYMFANGVLVQEKPLLDRGGMLVGSPWFKSVYASGDVRSAGPFLFARNCSACHTIGGINDISARLGGRSEDGIYVILGHTREMVSFMPPFTGTADERRILARFLYELGEGRVRVQSRARFVLAPGEGYE